MKKTLILLTVVSCLKIIFGQEITVETIDSLIDNYSVNEILLGNYEKAVKKIRSIEYNDSGLFYLALGEIALRKGEREKAIMNFIISAEKSEKVAPFAFRKLGDIELADGNLAYAVGAFRIAAQKTSFENYRYFLYSKVDSLKNAFPDSLGSVVWATIFWDAEQKSGQLEENPIEIIRKILVERKLTADLFNKFYMFVKDKKTEKNFLSIITDTTVADSMMNAKKAFEIANKMFDANLLSGASNWFHFAMNKKDFEHEISKRQYLEFRTHLNYSMKNWGNAIKYGKEYIAKYGETADLLYKVGRSYRQTGNLAEAHKYYQKHIKDYSNSKVTHDILWYMAWDREENKDFDSAKVLFRKLSNQKPIGTHGEESALRLGLLDFRRKKFDSALTEFVNFRKKFPGSVFVPASFYWTARSYAAKNDMVSAKKTIDTLKVKYPLTYYDFRSRQIFGDTVVSILKISDSVWYSRIDNIPKTETKGKATAENLDNLLLGIFLGTMGLKDEAELLFEPIESRNQKNYPMVACLAKFYAKIGAHYHSYRLVRRLYWALSSDKRGEYSPEYIKLFYPYAFAKEVDIASQKYKVEPQIVHAVMRQESMFSPTILSPVGAMGLMQIMPYTGKEIAGDLKVPFDLSSLLTPELNIDFGTYYLSKLLRQAGGNFVYAIAGYNGGLHNVKKWVENNKDVLDDEPYFVECVGFAQTRDYVKRVLENYWMYKLIQF